MTIYRISGYDFNIILMDAGLNTEKMAKLAKLYVMKNYGVIEQQIRNVIVDKMDGVIAVTVEDKP